MFVCYLKNQPFTGHPVKVYQCHFSQTTVILPRPLPEAIYGEDALERPLIGRRDTSDEDLPLLERLLRCTNADAHPEIAAALWDAASDAEAVAQLEVLATRCLGGWEAATRGAELVEDAVAEG